MRWGVTLSAFLVGFGVATAFAQLPPLLAPPANDGASLFKSQCGTCHTLDPAEPIRQGPPLKSVIGRRAGTYPGFHYSAGFAKADFAWDRAHLDAWLTDPQAVIPGAMMLYHQRDPAKRQAIIAFLETRH
jgi:cytochrome c